MGAPTVDAPENVTTPDAPEAIATASFWAKATHADCYVRDFWM